MTGTLTAWGPVLLWTVTVLPAVVGALLALFRPRSARLAYGVTLVTAAVLVPLSVVLALTGPTARHPFVLGAELGLGVDPLAGIVLVTVTTVALLVLLFAAADVEESPARFGGLMLLFVAAVVVTVTSTTLPTLILGWEVMGATSYALIGFSWRDASRPEAGAVAFLTTRAADLGLFVAAGAALAGGQGLGLADLARAESPWRDVIAAGIVVSALGKAAQLPFSFWLSRAMRGPSPVSALLHSAAMVAMGGYLLLRVPDLLAATPWAASVVAWAGALTTVALGLVALAQRDLKQLLAASTAAQLGFVVLAAGVGGVTGGLTQLVAHAATKALLFLAAGAWLSALGTKQLSALRGAARRWPEVGVTASVGLLSLAGVAPLSLWASKEAVLASALEGSVLLFGVGLVGAGLSAAYAGRVLGVLWGPTPDGVQSQFDTEERGDRQVPAVVVPVLAVLGLAAATLGLLTLPAVIRALRPGLGGEAPVPSPLELVGSAVLALVVLALAWRDQLPIPRWATSWLGLERGFRALVVAPTDRLAEALARCDDHVVDAGPTGAARAGLGLGRRTARFDDSRVDGLLGRSAQAVVGLGRRLSWADEHLVDAAVTAVARGLRRLGDLARRPQTGQLHQYYLQSAVLLTAAVVLLVVIG